MRRTASESAALMLGLPERSISSSRPSSLSMSRHRIRNPVSSESQVSSVGNPYSDEEELPFPTIERESELSAELAEKAAPAAAAAAAEKENANAATKSKTKNKVRSAAVNTNVSEKKARPAAAAKKKRGKKEATGLAVKAKAGREAQSVANKRKKDAEKEPAISDAKRKTEKCSSLASKQENEKEADTSEKAKKMDAGDERRAEEVGAVVQQHQQQRQAVAPNNEQETKPSVAASSDMWLFVGARHLPTGTTAVAVLYIMDGDTMAIYGQTEAVASSSPDFKNPLQVTAAQLEHPLHVIIVFYAVTPDGRMTAENVCGSVQFTTAHLLTPECQSDGGFEVSLVGSDGVGLVNDQGVHMTGIVRGYFTSSDQNGTFSTATVPSDEALAQQSSEECVVRENASLDADAASTADVSVSASQSLFEKLGGAAAVSGVVGRGKPETAAVMPKQTRQEETEVRRAKADLGSTNGGMHKSSGKAISVKDAKERGSKEDEFKRIREEEKAAKRKAVEDAVARKMEQEKRFARMAAEEEVIRRKAQADAAAVKRKARADAAEVQRKALEEAAAVKRKALEEAAIVQRQALAEAESRRKAQEEDFLRKSAAESALKEANDKIARTKLEKEKAKSAQKEAAEKKMKEEERARCKKSELRRREMDREALEKASAKRKAEEETRTAVTKAEHELLAREIERLRLSETSRHLEAVSSAAVMRLSDHVKGSDDSLSRTALLDVVRDLRRVNQHVNSRLQAEEARADMWKARFNQRSLAHQDTEHALAIASMKHESSLEQERRRHAKDIDEERQRHTEIERQLRKKLLQLEESLHSVREKSRKMSLSMSPSGSAGDKFSFIAQALRTSDDIAVQHNEGTAQLLEESERGNKYVAGAKRDERLQQKTFEDAKLADIERELYQKPSVNELTQDLEARMLHAEIDRMFPDRDPNRPAILRKQETERKKKLRQRKNPQDEDDWDAQKANVRQEEDPEKRLLRNSLFLQCDKNKLSSILRLEKTRCLKRAYACVVMANRQRRYTAMTALRSTAQLHHWKVLFRALAVRSWVGRVKVRMILRDMHDGIHSIISRFLKENNDRDHGLHTSGRQGAITLPAELEAWMRRSSRVCPGGVKACRDDVQASAEKGNGALRVNGGREKWSDFRVLPLLSHMNDVVPVIKAFTSDVMVEVRYWRDLAGVFFRRNNGLQGDILAIQEEKAAVDAQLEPQRMRAVDASAKYIEMHSRALKAEGELKSARTQAKRANHRFEKSLSRAQHAEYALRTMTIASPRRLKRSRSRAGGGGWHVSDADDSNDDVGGDAGHVAVLNSVNNDAVLHDCHDSGNSARSNNHKAVFASAGDYYSSCDDGEAAPCMFVLNPSKKEQKLSKKRLTPRAVSAQGAKKHRRTVSQLSRRSLLRQQKYHSTTSWTAPDKELDAIPRSTLHNLDTNPLLQSFPKRPSTSSGSFGRSQRDRSFRVLSHSRALSQRHRRVMTVQQHHSSGAFDHVEGLEDQKRRKEQRRLKAALAMRPKSASVAAVGITHRRGMGSEGRASPLSNSQRMSSREMRTRPLSRGGVYSTTLFCMGTREHSKKKKGKIGMFRPRTAASVFNRHSRHGGRKRTAGGRCGSALSYVTSSRRKMVGDEVVRSFEFANDDGGAAKENEDVRAVTSHSSSSSGSSGDEDETDSGVAAPQPPSKEAAQLLLEQKRLESEEIQLRSGGAAAVASVMSGGGDPEPLSLRLTNRTGF